MLQLIKTETEALQREIEEEKRHEPQIKLANAVGETAGSGTDELAGDAENMQPDRNKGVVIIGCYLRLTLETRNHDHFAEICGALRAAGYAFRE